MKATVPGTGARQGRGTQTARLAARALAAAIAASAAVCAAAAPSHAAAGATSPSKAKAVKVGLPFSASQPGFERHWWALPQTLRDGDTIQVAVQLAGEEFDLCLVPPTDDFGADDTVAQYCNDDAANTYSWVPYGTPQQDRETITYRGPSGQAYLTIYPDPWYDDFSYTVTIERIVTKVIPGMVVPSVVGRSFSVGAAMVYGDNTPVADGVGARLEWRYKPSRGSTPSGYTPLVDTYSAAGAAAFHATLPAEAQGRAIQLRACAHQPGGDSAICTADQDTTVAVGGPSPACVAARGLRRTRARQVSRLKSTTRRLTAKRAVVRGKSRRRVTRQLRRAKRKLRVAERRLAGARGNVRALC